MKKLLFPIMIAAIAVTSFCSSVGEQIVAKISNNSSYIQQQEQPLILEQFSAESDLMAAHYSHSSHSSHVSHRSHSSHYSSR